MMSQALTPRNFLNNTLDQAFYETFGKRTQGKVRDVYDRVKGTLVIVTTDRQSAFDIPWGTIPHKGAVINGLANWWFNKTKDVVPNHLIATPDHNVSINKKLDMFKVEVVVRAYMTGSTETSIWVNYNRGVRNFCGNELAEGMVKNQPLPKTIITPTTKGEKDESIDASQVVSKGLATEEQWQAISKAALALFAAGQKIALERGLILVDTKYEFGLDSNGILTVGDEVHTPDSSRFWVASTYEERLAHKLEPESLDKEFFRKWLISAGFDTANPTTSQRPAVTDEVRLMLSNKYIELYETVTGEKFKYPPTVPLRDRINDSIRSYLASH